MKYDLNETEKVAKHILNKSENKLIAFKGNLGAGKTTLIKAIVKNLGSDDVVSSPTFSLVNEYAGKDGPIYHFDLYRLEDIEEAYAIGLDEYLDSGAWCLIEWPERIMEVLPENVTFVEINKQLNGKRELKID
ncbi:tRNA (adenosine(37)-N6)-threonylcarbamoyltransferase complex ATPase subunit type 1 TsaE [Robertkochia aurantiaca]|uniref:tRNA (adenosine(37)-N6)-threonylcarbamoyltransferase complex ATPase subunit type 1 TsaE n=1 Tax=Robertkochia aurantiaca TaxID=2873700 RepID=UPI001CCD048E|nr:tRNA (adenosine(37)-N6)-threonylcarbamoyltransferase complex ATPase subunit type 1 TsaE [Robertkochia sp. 3YJGBD-33]